ncbi:MAG TPA: hypothetical protein VI520_05550 [Anaerolineales bacterium]|nr:hypothetical protein [Anaerolineales bacterium]
MRVGLKAIRPVFRTSSALVALLVAACSLAPTAMTIATVTPEPPNTAAPTETPAPTPSPVQFVAPPPPPPPTALSVSGPLTINIIQMIDRNTGWGQGVLGNGQATRILRTSDGGVTWQDVSPGLLDNFGRPAFFLDAQTAWAWAWEGSERWRTQDGGQKWSPVEGMSWGDELWFNNGLHGWRAHLGGWGWMSGFLSLGFDYLAITEDGAQTWQEVNPPPGNSHTYLALPDSQTAWALQMESVFREWGGFQYLKVPWSVLVTRDAGRTWQAETVPIPPDARLASYSEPGLYLDEAGLCEFVSPAYSSSTVWKFALTCEDQGWLYTTANQGQTWAINPLPQGALIRGLYFLNSSVGWILRWDELGSGLGRLYLTTDGGENWTLLRHTEWALAQFDFVDAGTGWAVASACTEFYCDRFEDPSALVKTTDGGLTWQMLEPRLRP